MSDDVLRLVTRRNSPLGWNGVLPSSLVSVAVAACPLVGCTTTVTPHESEFPYLPLSAMRAEPAATLTTPGAVVIREVEHEGFMNLTGPQAALYGHVYGTQLSVQDAFAFYNREGRSAGRPTRIR